MPSDIDCEATTQIEIAHTYAIVVPSEWSEDDLVKGDRECEASFEGTQYADVGSFLAATYIRA